MFSSKQILALVLAGALCLSLAACGGDAESSGDSGSGAEPEKTYQVTAVLPADSTSAALVLGGIEGFADEAGHPVEVTVRYVRGDKAVEAQLLSKLNPKKVQGVVAMPLTNDESIAELKRVDDRGIPVAIVGSSSDKLVFAASSLNADPYALGQKMGEQAKQYIQTTLSGSASIAIMDHASSNYAESNQYLNGFLDQVKDLEGVKLVNDLDLSRVENRAALLDSFVQNSAKADLVLCTSADITLAVDRALTAANYKAAIFGIGAHPELIQRMEEDSTQIVAVAAQDYYQMGYQSVAALLPLMEDPTAVKVGGEPVAPVLLTPGDSEGLDAFLEHLSVDSEEDYTMAVEEEAGSGSSSAADSPSSAQS